MGCGGSKPAGREAQMIHVEPLHPVDRAGSTRSNAFRSSLFGERFDSFDVRYDHIS